MTPNRLALIHAAAFDTQRPWTEAEFEALLASPSAHLFHHESGFLLLRLLPPDAEILTLAVAPEARRQGVGRHLVTEAMRFAQDAEASRMFLEVAASNAAARSLYERTGFVETGQRPDYYTLPDGGKDHAVMMEQAIGD
ncbi:ribosomal protein S18-alanine N-acetyltransferase [Fontisubflavum oceani]|uniref:ribosomal protein S18-alanine N-acetyltransferase n=1 Tax=Fontisubflavum oceani TaxID=2978973 RepID=UPI0025B2AEBB|nr:ribosomal protein S18-alanine N-acetyltransferase [Fontisubflavum oceani]WJY21936.1 ribosomal protein S18-alanine N-acetyltransferase [Fontisubflavum oceani]